MDLQDEVQGGDLPGPLLQPSLRREGSLACVPLMAAMLAEILRYVKGFAQVWFARHDEIARLVLAEGGRNG